MVTISWYDPARTILYFRFEGDWTWDEYEHAVAESYILMASMSHQVDVISHSADAQALKLPPGAIERWRNALLNMPENSGYFIHVPGNTFVRLLLDAFDSILEMRFRGKFRMSNTIEDAEALIFRLRYQQ